MASSASLNGRVVSHIFTWFLGVVPTLFYAALATIFCLYKLWISFGFALASAFLFFSWSVLNGVAIFSAMALARSRTRAAQRVIEIPSNERQATVSARGNQIVDLHPQLELLDVDTGSENGAALVSDDEVLSSIRDSVSNTLNAFGNGSSLRTTPENPTLKIMSNPLHPVRQTGAVVHATPRGAPSALPMARSLPSDETYTVSPPSFLKNKLAAASDTPPKPFSSAAPNSGQVSIPPPLALDLVAATSQGQRGCTSKSSAKQGEQLESPTYKGIFPNAIHPRDGSVASTDLKIQISGPSGSVRRAFMMPVISLYMIVVVSAVTLCGCFLFEYETHCLFFALPALSVPWLWTGLRPLWDYFCQTPGMRKTIHGYVLRVLVHKASMMLVCILSVGVFVAAFVLEILRWTPYQLSSGATPRPIRIISYVSPISTMIILAIASSETREMIFVGSGGAEWAEATGKRVGQSLVKPEQGATQRGPSPSLHGPQLHPSEFSTLGNFITSPLANMNAEGGAQKQLPGRALPLPSPQDRSEESCSVLSSIVRSSIASSIFIPPNSLASPTRLSVSKSLLRISQNESYGSNGGGGVHSNYNAPLNATVKSVPQLKTVTMLYIAYRDIYDDEDFTTIGIQPPGQKGGMIANRNMQQAVAANFEAIMEALEEAKELGSADANAYILTAYEDALCLVWGLIPFSSEPVLLAIEKARQIVEAFKSRPKPPTNSSQAQQELVAAVVYAPHSLVGLVGSGSYRGFHFFNPLQHEMGSQLLRRGLAMYRRLPSTQLPSGESEVPFNCLLMDGRAWNSTASHVLARPCGITRSRAAEMQSKQRINRCGPINASARAIQNEFTIMYNFMTVVQAKEEEWHLVVQRQERLGAKFGFLTEAVQQLHQGDPSSAKRVLQEVVTSTTNAGEDNVVLAQMLLEDLQRIDGNDGLNEMYEI